MNATTRPTVTISYAQTLDGRLATTTGSSRWISGPESLTYTHALRAAHDAIMVGAGTVAHDNPRLTVRLVEGRDPLRVIVDSRLRTPLDAAALAGEAAHGTVIAITDAASHERISAVKALGARVLVLPKSRSGQVDLPALLTALAGMGIGSVMVEGGAGLITSLLQERLADRLAVTIAPKLLGRGIEAIGDLGISDLAAAIELHDMTLTPYGVDLVLDGRLVYADKETGEVPR